MDWVRFIGIHNKRQVGAFIYNQISAVAEAYMLQRIIGDPPQKDFEEITYGNMIQNCPITVDGPNLAGIRGK